MPALKKSWTDKWNRLTSMDGREFGDRVRQHAMARMDALRYRAGIGFANGTVQTNKTGRFFFTPNSVPSLCSLLKERLPGDCNEILKYAEMACEHRFDLLGYEALHYGTKIDWHADVVHAKTAPRKPWYQIHYLDAAEVGDSKVTWELNRHQHFVTLAKAYRLTGDKRYLREILDQWQHWHSENPYPIGINWASSLEVAFRSLSWIWTHFLLEGSDGFPADFKRQWLEALSVSGRHIECYLSTYFSPNTHLLGEAVALFFIGVVCPELKSAERWRHLGWEIVTQESQRQVQADGLHFEQSTYYHVYALDFFLHAAILANVNDLPVPPSFDTTLENMLEALRLLTRAGNAPTFGDDDGGRLFDPHRNRVEHLTDPLSTGAVLFSRGDFKAIAGSLREETVWLLGVEGAKEFDRIPTTTPDLSSAALSSAGLYFMAGPDQQLVIDAGPHGASSAGHGHADALSICVNSDRKPLLIDPGTCEYVGESRRLFRGTQFHNTVCVDARGQATPTGPFSWDRLPQVQAEGWITGQTFDLFAGSHDGFAPIIHRRWVFALKGKFWMVRDQVLGDGEHKIESFWHLSSGFAHRGDEYVEREGSGALRILTERVEKVSREFESGWFSPVYGKKEASPVLHFSTVSKLPYESVTLLVTGGGQGRDERVAEERLQSGDTGSRAYRYRAGEGDHLFIFSDRSRPWSVDEWSGDAEFVYVGRRGAHRHLILCNGTYLETMGKKFISATGPIMRCEILASEKEVQSFCSDESVVIMKDVVGAIATEQNSAVSSVPVPEGTVS